MLNRHSIPISVPAPQPTAAHDYRTQHPPFRRPDPVRPPEGAPNVLLVMLDDVGFGASSAFGGPCRTPTAERLAGGGAAYSRFHTTALCSPTRSATLTGRNHHSVGFGVIAEMAAHAPGYNGTRPDSAATVARVLQGNGYATGAFGKMHQTPPWEITPAGPFDRWPVREGFEKFYGFLGAEADQFEPVLYDGFRVVDPPTTPEQGYHLSEDLVDQALNWTREVETMDPDKPWLCYLSFGACHAPLQVPDSYRDKYRGAFDHGWNAQREITLARQRELGVVGPDAVLAPWPDGAPLWEDLDEDQRVVAARLMELYAAFLEHTDDQVGRMIDELERRGALEDTLVIYMLGDNGASAEGGFDGALNYLGGLNGEPETAAEIRARIDELGTRSSYPHFPSSWAFALDTPYQWAKQVASHYGGTRNGLIMHWPGRIAEPGTVRHQWHHCVDITPTILAAAGVPAPETVDGVAQQPMAGVAMDYTFDDPRAEDRHLTQYFEIFGNRGVYHRGWTAVTAHRPPWLVAAPADAVPSLDEDRWELYDTTVDWTQAEDLAEEHPEKLAELQQLFLAEAARYQVLPIDDRTVDRYRDPASLPPHPMRGRTSITLYPHMDGLVEKAAPDFRSRAFTLTARFDPAAARTAPARWEGMLASLGGRFGGFALYLLEGRPVFCYNHLGRTLTRIVGAETLGAQTETVAVRFDYAGGFGGGGHFTLTVDGRAVADGAVERTQRGMYSMNEQFDIGRNRGSAVAPDFADRRPFACTAPLESVTVDLAAAPGVSTLEEYRIALATH